MLNYPFICQRKPFYGNCPHLTINLFECVAVSCGFDNSNKSTMYNITFLTAYNRLLIIHTNMIHLIMLKDFIAIFSSQSVHDPISAYARNR